ncbi:MAG: hypothetical protein ACU0BB_08845 [Paracoccaceae bacterium]|jgi:hypothetical protein
MTLKHIFASSTVLTFAATAASASAPVPGPLAGAAFGPAGLAVAAVGYVAYRVVKARRDN